MSRVIEKGQATIPKEIRERLGIRRRGDLRGYRRGVPHPEGNRGRPVREVVGVVETDESVEERMADLRG
jgi:hypothetical protein